MPEKRTICAQTTPGDGTVPTFEAFDQDGVFECAYQNWVEMLAHLVAEGERRILIHDGEKGFGLIVTSIYIPATGEEAKVE